MPDPAVSADASVVEFERIMLRTAVKSGTQLEILEALADYITEQLEANMCHTCRTSKLQHGSQASLIQRLQLIMDEVVALKAKSSSVNRLAGVRKLHVVDDNPSGRRSATGTRRPGGGRKAGDAS